MKVAAPQLEATLQDRSARSRGQLPAWPLVALLAGYPIWWALGLGTFVFIMAGAVTAVLLLRRGGILVPPGFGLWLLFVLWTIASLSMLDVNPPGTLVEPWTDRLLVPVFRLTFTLAITSLALYVGNMRPDDRTASRLGWLMGSVFAVSVAGGYLAIVAPRFGFTSPVEMLLPSSMTSNPWLLSMVHPSAAQIQDFLGYEAARPAAPFPYTNTWGANLALLLPWFVSTWIIGATGRRRLVGTMIAGAAVVPVVVSLNRGLWLALGVVAAVAVVRSTIRGQLLPALVALAGVAALAIAILVTPLGNIASDRLENQHSNGIREFTTVRALEASSHSPVLGFGTTRSALGSNQSLAIGKTPECPRCGNTPLGQNGHLWLILISHGVVGLILFYAYFGFNLARWSRSRAPLVQAGFLSLSVGLFLSVFYDMAGTPMAFMMLTLGTTWAAEQEHRERSRLRRGQVHA